MISRVKDVIKTSPDRAVEVTTAKEIVIRVGQRQFFLVFLKFLGSLYGITNGQEIEVLGFLMQHAVGNKVKFTAELRTELMRRQDSSSQNISNCLSRLRDKEVISGGVGRIYKIDDALMWLGGEQHRTYLLDGPGIHMRINFVR